MTPTEIAAAIRQHSPGCLPESYVERDGILHVRNNFVEGDGRVRHTYACLPDDIAEAVLRDAMVRDGHIEGCPGFWQSQNKQGRVRAYWEVNHGGSLGACYAAWCWAKGINDA